MKDSAQFEMSSRPQTLLYFGDQTDAWVDGIDQLYRQAATTPWIQAFLDDLLRVLKDESQGMDDVLRDSLGDYSSLLELAERYRHKTDEVGMARAILLHAVRAGMLLQWVKQEPQLVSTVGPKPERLGISGGLTNLCALAVSTDFASLYSAVLEVARIFVRLCRFTSVRSRAMEDRPGVWGWAILGIAPDDLSSVLDQFQQSRGIPPIKRAKIGVTGDRWSTVIGPPSVLELVVSQCPALRDLPKNELSIHALQHVVTVSQADLDFIVGSSAMLSTPILPDFRVWGMDDPQARYSSWGELLQAVVFQVLSLPLDITKVVDQLNSWLGPSKLDVKIIGPSSHTPYLASALKGAGSSATFHSDRSLEKPQKPSSGRIAIVGMGGRGPGSDNLEEFWNVVMSKQDLCEEIPKDRFDIEEFYCTEHKNTCTTTTRFGCFMNKPGYFDSRFFHVSPREALLMDPGHRQFLMSTYEALEMAGYSNGQTRATDPQRIAAFYGQSNDDWHMVSHYALGCDAYTLQGAQRAFGAGRAAFYFKWGGPTYSLDSACASSSSATHLACLSLLTGDVDMAVVGAANIVGYPHSWTSLSKSGVLSDTGNCKTFRDDADGYCRADFVGTVVLKRLEDAVAQNDNILAVVASSGRNHSGNSTSITTSDAGAQELLFRKIMRSARVSPDDISYVEMHGTGTQTGDPAEMTAVANVFKHRQERRPLTVGSVKANIGHSEAAAGMASLLKCIMMFQKDIMPPQAGIPHALNPKYPPLSELNIEIPSEPKEFKAVDRKPRRILLNNFDAAGGNASMLLEDYTTPAKERQDPRPHHVVVISARTQASYLANKQNLLHWLRANKDADVHDIAYTTTARRMHHPIRFACTASNTQELTRKIENATSEALPSRASEIVFVFTGQGSHYAGMGSELYATCHAFREAVDLCASICADLEFPLFLDIITDGQADVSTKNTTQLQLAVVTLEVGLAALWRSCGIRPSMVTGHSLGEYVALYVSGVLSLADMLYLVGHRARLFLERCEADVCAMLAISASPASVQELLDARPHSSCSIACVNSPRSTVVSGSTDDIAELQAGLTTPSKKLSVPYGFHSSQMDPMLDDYVALAGGVTFSAPKVPVASTLLGATLESQGVINGHYLGQHIRQPVNFVGALQAITEKLTNPLWLEIGPSSVCSSFVRATLAPPAAHVISSLEASTNPWNSISICLAGAYMNGVAIDWFALHAPFTDGLKLLNLPSYAWDTKDFWIQYTESGGLGAPTSADVPAAKVSTCAQYVVRETWKPALQVTLKASIASSDFAPLVDGHRIRGVSIVPGSVFCDAGLAAVKYVRQHGQRKDAVGARFAMRNVSLKQPLTRGLVGSAGELLTSVAADSSSEDVFQVSWTASAGGLSHELGGCSVSVIDAEKLQAQWGRISYFARSRMDELTRNVKDGHGHRMLPGILYALFSKTVEYDPAFQCISEAFISKNFEEAAAEVILKDDPKGTQFVASPYWGESLVHLAGFLVNCNPERLTAKTTFMMDSFDSFEQMADFQSGRPYLTYVRISQREKRTTSCDVYVFDSEKLVMQCSALRFHEVSNEVLDHVLGKPAARSQGHGAAPDASATSATKGNKPQKPTTEGPKFSSGMHLDSSAVPEEPKIMPVTVEDPGLDSDAFAIILESIASGTGTGISELTDDIALVELGVDSIMGIEIATRINRNTGLDMLPSFIVEYPTIGDLRAAFASSQTGISTPEPISGSSVTGSSPGSTVGSQTTPAEKPASVVDDISKDQLPAVEVDDDIVVISQPAKDDSPAPSARVTLLQGRPSSGKRPFYLIADGTGSIATYIHLPPFRSKMPVYGIDSPYLRCPSRLSAEVGIVSTAKLITQALLQFQPEGSFSIGGYSGGAMLGYEVCRQLAKAGRSVDSLLLIDMCCPRPAGSEDKAEIGWRVYESMAAQGGSWNASNATQQHMRAIFASVAAYHPPPMTLEERPRRTAIIWAEKGLIDRCSGDLELMQLLARSDVPTEPFPGFMEDARMGAIAWGLPHKRTEDLGPNGWDKFVGGIKCLSIHADHLEMPMPGHVHLLHKAMEEAFVYLNEV